MRKPNPLQAALERVEKAPPNAPKPSARKHVKTEEHEAPKRKSSREGTVLIGGHFPPSVKQQLRMIAAEEDTTSQALLGEALELLFIKKGKANLN